MSTGSTTLPENGPPTPAVRRRWAPRLHDARIRSKLALILAVPLTAVLALATVRLVDVGSRARDANQVEELAELSSDISAVTQNMHRERMAAARYLASPARSAAANSAQDAYNEQVARTDALIVTYTADRRGLDGRVQVEPQGQIEAVQQPTVIEARLDKIDDHLRTMDATRRKVLDRDQIAVAEVVLRYGVVITDLLGFGEALSQFASNSGVADTLRAVAAFSRAKAGAAEQEAVAYAARTAGALNDEQYAAFVATQTSQQEALLAFSLAANPEQRALVDSTVTGDAVALADRVSTELSRSVGKAPVVSAEDAAQAIGAVVDLMRWAEVRLESGLVDAARAENTSVTRQAIIEAVLVLLTLVIAIVLAVVLARSLSLSLRRLREGALSVANRDLPEAVASLRDVQSLGEGGADDIVRQLRDPIQMTNTDEIGQVAQAFNVVHREAVRIAAEQAALRTSVSAMFLNLARRSQSLVDRMIGELDQIERGEEDPKRLAQLFELDHLATRMRRNDENLLVLAGADSSPPRREDALLVDALRAAQSEVELYNRVEFGTVDTDIFVSALAVNDVVRLIAELLDNATRFSPPATVVVADGRRIRDYVVIQIEDRGLGMSEEQMEALNRRLAQPPDVDVAAFRLMGLAVVGRLASRYGIRVELRANIEGGTVAQVILPNSIVVLSRSGDPLIRQHPPTPPAGPPAPRGWGDTAPAHRSGTATATLPGLPAEPWQLGPGPTDDRLVRSGSGQPAMNGRTDQQAEPVRRADSVAPPMAPRPTSPAVSEPALPVMPNHVQPPTPGRPALPSRPPRPATASPATASPATASPVTASPVSATPASAAPGVRAGAPAVSGPVASGPVVSGPIISASPVVPAGPIRPASADPILGGPVLSPLAGQVRPVSAVPDATRPGLPESAVSRSTVSGSTVSGSTVSKATPSEPVVSEPVPAGPVVSGAVVAAAAQAGTAVDAVTGSPTVAHRTVQTSAYGMSAGQVATRPAAPQPGWGAALAAMPPAPPPPPPTPIEDRADSPIFREMQASWFLEPDESRTQEWSLPTAGYAPPSSSDTASAGGPGSRDSHRATVPYVSPLPARPTATTPAATRPSGTGPSGTGPSGTGPSGTGSAPTGPSAGSRSDGGFSVGDTGGAGRIVGKPAVETGRGGAIGPGNGQNGDASTGREAGDDTGGQQAVPRPSLPAGDAWRTAADEGWHRAMAAAEPPDAGKTRSGLPKRVPQAQLVPGGVQSGPRDATRRTPDEVRGLLSAYHRGVQRGRTAGSADTVATAPAPKENEQ